MWKYKGDYCDGVDIPQYCLCKCCRISGITVVIYTTIQKQIRSRVLFLFSLNFYHEIKMDLKGCICRSIYRIGPTFARKLCPLTKWTHVKQDKEGETNANILKNIHLRKMRATNSYSAHPKTFWTQLLWIKSGLVRYYSFTHL